MRTRLIVTGFVILLIAVGVNVWITLNTRSSLTTVVKESAATRVTTVTQRCGLTTDVERLSRLAAAVITEFAPKLAGPFDRLDRTLLASYAGCEKQLKRVKSINAHAP